MEAIGPQPAGSERGLVLGSFCPVHTGHIALWEFGARQVDQLIVALCARPSDEIPGKLRLTWIREILQQFPYAFLLDYVYDEHEALPWGKEGSSRDASQAWSDFFVARYKDNVPTTIFSSEDYGDYMAEYMGNKHVMFDRQRVSHPISSRQIRANPQQYEQFIPNEVKSYYR